MSIHRLEAEEPDVRPIFLETHDRGPEGSNIPFVAPHREVRAVAILPLVGRGSPSRLLTISFSEPRSFDREERTFLETLSSLVALAADRIDRDDRLSELREADRKKDEFLAILGHELRNPLAPMLAALELMKLEDDTVFGRERAMIERHVSHVLRLVDDLLDVSRIAHGKLGMKTQRLEMGTVLAEALERVAPELEKKRLRLVVDLAYVPLRVVGDSARLSQVFTNLLNNAVKFTEPGGKIELRAYRDGDRICVMVTDSGIGFPAEVARTLFEPFVQGPENRVYGGLGLGLAVVHRLVDMHGGDVEAFSAGRGQGSRFTVRLPRATGETSEGERPASAPHSERERLVTRSEDGT